MTRGRAATLSLGLVVALLVLGYAALRALELAPPAPTPEQGPVDPATADDGRGWTALVPLGHGAVRAWLLPLHEEELLGSFRATALRERFQLEEGSPWRLYLSLSEPAAAALAVETARVLDEQGPALSALAGRLDAAPGDPLAALLGSRPAPLAGAAVRPLFLWGRAPGPGARLVLGAGGAEGEGVLEATAPGALAAPRWLAAEPLERVRTLEEEVEDLRAELERERARRLEREQAFLEFGRMVSQIPRPRPDGAAAPEAPPETDEQRALREKAEAARARAEELGLALGVLFRLEGVRGLDLLDAGTLHEGGIGPVVFRCLDERGSLAGGLNAATLHLEGSQAARTLTVVLEDGFESRAGERVPFEGGVRRITLTHVDPEAWLERCPELFTAVDLESPSDDGRWNAGEVRRELNRLLALETSGGWYRLHSLGGVRGQECLDVQLEELETSGRLRRRLFADRLRIHLEDASVVLELQDGASVRGEEKTPFRGGALRVVLPGVPLAEWRTAKLPGLSDPPEKAAPRGTR